MSEQTIERVGERARERTGDSVSRQVDGTHGPFAVSPTRPTAGPGADGWSGAPRRLEPGPASRARSVRVVVAVLIVVSAIGYLIYTGFQSTTVYYLTVSELKAKGPAAGAVRVAGIVQANTVVRSANDATVHFTIADQGGSLPVVYLPGRHLARQVPVEVHRGRPDARFGPLTWQILERLRCCSR